MKQTQYIGCNANTLSAQGEIEGIEKQLMTLNQKKEDLLVDLKAAILKLHQHLQQEQQELEKEMPSAGASEEDGVAERDVSEWKVGMTLGWCQSHIPQELQRGSAAQPEKPEASVSMAYSKGILKSGNTPPEIVH